VTDETQVSQQKILADIYCNKLDELRDFVSIHVKNCGREAIDRYRTLVDQVRHAESDWLAAASEEQGASQP
jgi:hypothetical protein